MYYLFLDDVREPSDVKWLVSHIGHRPCDLPMLDWLVVRDFNEFTACIGTNGIPIAISFDHDLAPDHYPTVGNHSPDYDRHEKTGFHCAKWLVELCIDTCRSLPPEIFIHSLNPIGKKNIESIIISVKNTFNWL